MYYILEPEVAGGFGEETVFVDRTARPPVLERFHYRIEDWLGDELLMTVGCFVISDRLATLLQDESFSGIEFAVAQVTATDQFRELSPDVTIPCFKWLRVVGKRGADDFGLSQQGRLVLSERALFFFQKNGGIAHAEVKEASI